MSAAATNLPAGGPDVDDWSTLFEGLPVGAFRSLPNGRFVRVNSALARMSGFDTAAELVAAVDDLSVDWFVNPGRRREVLALLEREGSARGIVSEIFHQASRRRIWISENSYVIRDAAGRVAYYEGTVEEITDRVHAHQALAQREALLRDVTAGVPGMVYRLHAQPDGGRFYEFVSEGVRALYGVEPEAVLADPGLLGRLRHPQDHADVEAALQSHLASGQASAVEFRIRPVAQPEKWVRLTSSVSRQADGSNRLHGVVIDITAEKEAEEALRSSNQRWLTALERLGDGVWDWDVTNDRCELSGPLQRRWGLGPENVDTAMCACDAIMHADDVASMRAARQACLDGRTPSYAHEHRMRLREGGWVWVLSRGIVVQRDQTGRPLRMVGTHTDITERREVDALRQQRDLAEAADRAKSELMSRISHELRTPLNAILGFAQLLEGQAVPGSPEERWTGHVLAGGRLLLGLVEDVLDLTQGQAVQFSLNLQPVDLRESFQACWSMLAPQAEAQGVTLLPLASGPELAVRADPKRLHQVLTNLLSNAIKYGREGGHVQFEMHALDETVAFSVTDTGHGIGPEYLPRLFQPFDRLGAARGKIPGTGLGLVVCKQLVEAMGGTICASSQLDVGSCFLVKLPRAAADASQGS